MRKANPVVTSTLIIPSRFNGPLQSANGGFTCGVLSKFVDSNTVEVTLHRPPPLDHSMTVDAIDKAVTLTDGEQVIASAMATERLDFVPASIPALAAVRAAESAGEAFCRGHTYPTCFVCGVQREQPDGLRLFAGPVATNLWGVIWTPTAEFVDEDNNIKSEIVSAALDCPTYPAAQHGAEPADPALLGRFTVTTTKPIKPNEQYLIVSWNCGVQGRKRRARSALVTQEGTCHAVADALWITLRTGDRT